jgi:hypothetical protein
MSTVIIYKEEQEVFHLPIRQEFYIVEAPTGELFWHENTDVKRPGVLKIWLKIMNKSAKLSFVLPDWQLIINGRKLEKSFYEDVENLEGKEVELQYKEYRFVFHFD